MEKENRLCFVSPTINQVQIGTYDEWMTSNQDPTNKMDQKAIHDATVEKILSGEYGINKMYDTYLGSDPEGKRELVEQLLDEHGNKVTITGELMISSGDGTYEFTFTISNIQIDVEAQNEVEGSADYTYEALINDFFEGNKPEGLDDEIKNKIKNQYYYSESIQVSGSEYLFVDDYADNAFTQYKDTMTITVKGDKTNYEIIRINLPDDFDKEEIKDSVKQELAEDESDLGGWLLSPVFYLINFIADAIVSNVGNLMRGESLSLISGAGLLQSSPIPVSSEVTDDQLQEISIDSFDFGGIQYPNIKYTPEEIFAGEIDLLSIDFISGKNYKGVQNSDSNWLEIRKVISQWYQVLRMIAIIGLLSVLIYMGIKIIISANAKDKAKYKQWIMDWLIAVVILFVMHYIMAFIIAVTGELSALISEASAGINVVLTEDNVRTSTTFSSNLMGLVRFMVQSEDFYMKIGYEIMYIALIVYTIKFTIVYLKRVLSMAFLTLIAPIVALTYPIDKLNDGKAQGFDMWVKEYTFNALLQPVHCLLYYILVGSAVGLAGSNPIYGIVVLMFMTQAENLLKKIFGFEKATAGTVGGMAGAFAAGALASNIKNIARMAKLPAGNGDKPGSGYEKNETLDNPKPTNSQGMAAFSDDEGESTGGSTNTTENTNTEAEEDNEDSPDNQEKPETHESNEGPSETDTSGENPEKEKNEEGQQENKENVENEEQEDKNEEKAQNKDNGERIRDKARRLYNAKVSEENRQKISRFGKGAKAVGKRIAKPVWDFDHTGKEGAKYNGKRLVRKVGKGALKAAVGFSLGAAAAAVQAGISITDGKYSPMEGFGTFAAGAMGGSRIVDGMARGMGSIADTYREGSLPDDPKKRKEEIMRRAKERYPDREDVIAFNKKNYAGHEKEAMQRQRDHYLTAGVTDLKEMKSGMKYADTLVGNTDGLSQEQIQERRRKADQKAAATIDFRKTLKEQGQLGSVYDKDKQDKYIQTMVDREGPALNPNASLEEQKQIAAQREKIQRQYENAFKSVAAYDAANA